MIFNNIRELKLQGKKIGITFSTFDLLHAGHIAMLAEAKNHCDYLICGLQTDPTINRPDTKNKPVQSIIERQIQVSGCRYVDEIIVYNTEEDLLLILNTLPINIRILGSEYQSKPFTGVDLLLDIYYNKRDHLFSSTALRKRVYQAVISEFVKK